MEIINQEKKQENNISLENPSKQSFFRKIYEKIKLKIKSNSDEEKN